MAQNGKRKGISLPINMVVILAVAVLVLVVVAAFFVLQAGGGQRTINDQTAWASGCATSIARNCNAADFRAGDDGLKIANYDPYGNDERPSGSSVCLTDPKDSSCSDNTLYEACRRAQNIVSDVECRNKCCGGQAGPTTTTP